MTTPSVQRLSRLLSLVPWLSRHQGVTVTEAAEHFGVDPEQLERDLWLVVCCGLPGHGPDQLIDIQFWDDDGHIDVVDPQTLVAPARLTVDEAAALQVGLSILASLAGEDDRRLIDATMAILTEATAVLAASEPTEGFGASVPQDDTERQDRHGVTGTNSPVRTDLGADPGITAAITSAAHERQAVEIEYYGATQDALSRRVIWPQRIIVSATVVYVEAWCASARDMRTFRADRIQSVDPVRTESHATPATTHSISQHSSPSGEPTEVIVNIHPDSRWLLDTFDFALPKPDHGIPEAESGSGTEDREWIAASIRIWDKRWLTRLVLGMGGDLVVVSPQSLRADVRDAALRGLSAQGSQISP